VFEAATAFTSVRRVQILRHLCGGGADSESLRQTLHMSRTAAARHLEKLMGRGYVVAVQDRRRPLYRLATTLATSVHERLLATVSQHW
jgi:DNA-binding transcriptional ArsR family regulator